MRRLRNSWTKNYKTSSVTGLKRHMNQWTRRQMKLCLLSRRHINEKSKWIPRHLQHIIDCPKIAVMGCPLGVRTGIQNTWKIIAEISKYDKIHWFTDVRSRVNSRGWAAKAHWDIFLFKLLTKYEQIISKGIRGKWFLIQKWSLKWLTADFLWQKWQSEVSGKAHLNHWKENDYNCQIWVLYQAKLKHGEIKLKWLC